MQKLIRGFEGFPKNTIYFELQKNWGFVFKKGQILWNPQNLLKAVFENVLDLYWIYSDIDVLECFMFKIVIAFDRLQCPAIFKIDFSHFILYHD